MRRDSRCAAPGPPLAPDSAGASRVVEKAPVLELDSSGSSGHQPVARLPRIGTEVFQEKLKTALEVQPLGWLGSRVAAQHNARYLGFVDCVLGEETSRALTLSIRRDSDVDDFPNHWL
jgi:hypothetical protein